MRILHFADVHIGVESYGRPATEADVAALPAHFAPELSAEQRVRTYAGLSTRLLDFLAALDQVVAEAVARRVDVALFCGDAYKSRDPSQTQQREFARRVARLAQAGVPVFLLVGNHDQPHSLGRATALDIFPLLLDLQGGVPQVVVADRVATHRMETRSGPLQVVAVPWVRRGAFLAAEEHHGKSQEELAQFVQDRLTELVMAEAARLDPTAPAVVAAHVTVMGGVGGSEQSMALGRDHVLQRSALALPGVDYVALGHLHRHQAIGGGTPPVVYSGSLQRVDFGEEAEEKGFCVVEISPSPSPSPRGRGELEPPSPAGLATSPSLRSRALRGSGRTADDRGDPPGRPYDAGPSTGSGRADDGGGDAPGRPYDAGPLTGSGRTVAWEFVPVKARSFVTVDVTLDASSGSGQAAEESSPTQRVLEAIGRKHIRDAVVRVRIAGPEAAVRGVDERAVRQALAPAHHVAAIARDVTRDERPRLGVAASSLTPEEALRRYLETRQGASEAVRARAMEVGRQLIQEEQAREPSS